MKLKIIKMYEMPINFDAWIIDFIYRDESIQAVIMYEDGTLSSESIVNLTVEVKQ